MFLCHRGDSLLKELKRKSYELGVVDSKDFSLYKKFTNYKEKIDNLPLLKLRTSIH